MQDLGSSFGKPGSLGTNPRGDFRAWQTQSVFANADRCELKYPLKGESTVLQEAQELLVGRLEKLDRAAVKAIFAAARFQMVDQKQLERLRHGGAADPEDAALERVDGRVPEPVSPSCALHTQLPELTPRSGGEWQRSVPIASTCRPRRRRGFSGGNRVLD